MGKTDLQPQTQPTPHVKTVYSTKPGHKTLRRERCTCSVGSDHIVYESR